MIPSYHTILHNMQKDFIGAIYSGNTKEVATQTNSSNLHSLYLESSENQARRDFDPVGVEQPIYR